LAGRIAGRCMTAGTNEHRRRNWRWRRRCMRRFSRTGTRLWKRNRHGENAGVFTAAICSGRRVVISDGTIAAGAASAADRRRAEITTRLPRKSPAVNTPSFFPVPASASIIGCRLRLKPPHARLRHLSCAGRCSYTRHAAFSNPPAQTPPACSRLRYLAGLSERSLALGLRTARRGNTLPRRTMASSSSGALHPFARCGHQRTLLLSSKIPFLVPLATFLRTLDPFKKRASANLSQPPPHTPIPPCR